MSGYYAIRIRFDHVSADAEPQPDKWLYFRTKMVKQAKGHYEPITVLAMKSSDEAGNFEVRKYSSVRGAKCALAAKCVRDYRSKPHYFVEIVETPYRQGDNKVVWPKVLDQLARLG